jgi:hypothetical protein
MPKLSLMACGLLAAAVLAGGCGKEKTSVQGEVTLDGAAVDEGLITFEHSDGTHPESAAIKDGKYTREATPGATRVKITAPKVTGKRPAYDEPGSPTIDVTTERIPAKYNAKTELTAEIKPGLNIIDWPLKSK